MSFLDLLRGRSASKAPLPEAAASSREKAVRDPVSAPESGERLTAETLIAALGAHRWVRASDRALFEVGSFSLVDEHTFRVGDHEGSLEDLLAAAAETGRPVDEIDRLRLVTNDWIVNDFVRLKPLVYLCAYGSADYFEMMRLCVESLFRYGAFDGDVLVVTDETGMKTSGEQLAGLEPALRSRISFLIHEAGSMAEMCLSRFHVGEHPPIARYSPIIYLDVDVLCDGSLEKMIIDATLSNKLLAKSEGKVLNSKDWYGGSLFLGDATGRFQNTPAFSSGVMTGPSSAFITSLFKIARRVADGAYKARGEHFALGDQPIANYCFFKLGVVDQHGLDAYVRLNGHAADPDPGDRRGLVHFSGGVGRGDPKVNRMRRYSRTLAEAGESRGNEPA